MTLLKAIMLKSLILSQIILTAMAAHVYVELTTATNQEILTVQVCTGLYNRESNFGGVYTFMDQTDRDWLLDIEGVTDPEVTDITVFINKCLSTYNGYILYDYKTQQALIPNLITFASINNVTLLDVGSVSTYDSSSSTVLFDASVEWLDFNPLMSSKYVYNYVNDTTTLSWMNPGYDNFANPSDPPLTQDPKLGLTDYIVKERIFNIYINDACIPNTPEYEFMSMMVNNNPWPR